MSRTDLPLSILWRNRQTEVCLVLRPKPRKRCGDFEAQITKPKLLVLRPKPRNPPPPWFWGSTKKPTLSFEIKPGETVATSFEAKLEKTVATSFEAKPAKTVVAGFVVQPRETVTIGFEAKPAKTVRVVLRPNHSRTVAVSFEAQTDEKPSEWFWGSTKKLTLLVSMCTVLTAHGVTRPLNRPATEYPTCATIPDPLHQVS
jgi:hypothetical protein